MIFEDLTLPLPPHRVKWWVRLEVKWCQLRGFGISKDGLKIMDGFQNVDTMLSLILFTSLRYTETVSEVCLDAREFTKK
jgi:hypothetical protein